MEKPHINFFSEDIKFDLQGKRKLRDWIRQVIENEEYRVGDLNFVFCDDHYLFAINKTYLKHNTLTDIITFDMSDEVRKISGDIFISIQRVRENAKAMKSSFRDELHRVMIHGVLHLFGYNDKLPEEKLAMRAKEDYYLSLMP